MRIQNNITAQNSHRQYGINNVNIGKNVEKLSSGFRVNRAADDAAGLAISEKMRTQIRGLNMASRNAQDGISLVQTAEGAMQAAHDIMQRMREIAVQASNGTNDDLVDRRALNLEFAELNEELSQIEGTVKFNDMQVFDQTFTLQSGANAGDTTHFSIGRMATVQDTFAAIVYLRGEHGDIYTLDPINPLEGVWIDRVVHSLNNEINPGGVYSEEFIELLITERVGAAANEDTRNADRETLAGMLPPIAVGRDVTAVDWETLANDQSGVQRTVAENLLKARTPPLELDGPVDYTDPGTVAVGAARAPHANPPISYIAGTDTLDNAQIALEALTITINGLSTNRASLGAIQNRLEFKIANLDNSAENLAAAESRIRDVDMAKMMTEFTKNNILFQASTAMLAQANALPQGVLQLLG